MQAIKRRSSANAPWVLGEQDDLDVRFTSSFKALPYRGFQTSQFHLLNLQRPLNWEGLQVNHS